jgi:hypothetical protein
MASEPNPIAAEATAIGNPHSRRADQARSALFCLETPIRMIVDGEESDVHGLEVRELCQDDLGLLDRFHGQPIALIQNLLAALCGITVDHVRQLDLEDFTILSEEVAFQVEKVASAMGFPPRFFFEPRAVGDAQSERVH